MRFIIAFFFLPLFVFPQNNEQRLAYQYYVNGEYEKAILIYQDLSNKSLASYYNPFFLSLMKVEKYKEAKVLSNKMLSKYREQISYRIDFGIANEKIGNNREAKKQYKYVFERMNGTMNQSNFLSSRFISHEMYNHALDIYFESEKINKKANFTIKKAEIYSYLGQDELMIKEYLASIIKQPSSRRQVTSKIQRFIDNDGIHNENNYKLVKHQLLLVINNEKNNYDFSEILIWLYMQHSDFHMALIQAKALDKRKSGTGSVVFDLGEVLLDYEEYDLAIDAYEYVISLGKENDLFITSSINRLYALTKLIGNEKDILNIQDIYIKLITDLGKNKKTVLLLSNYAHFQAFYLFDLNSASLLLEETMNINQISVIDLAHCKLEYADIQLLMGNIWESLLYYSQVEKDFQENPIGHEAKLRKAKISYYQGDFSWAQAQLEVLKASTSKLIANDAMKISLLISDNYNLDTSNIPMQIFAKADLLVYQKKINEAFLKYDSILEYFPGHSLEDEIYMRKADVYYKQDSLYLAIDMYQKIMIDFNYDILADDAIYKQAKIYDERLNDLQAAKNLYEKIIIDYNNSVYVAESRKRYRDIRGDNLNIEK